MIVVFPLLLSRLGAFLFGDIFDSGLLDMTQRIVLGALIMLFLGPELRFGNAFSEFGSKRAVDFDTRCTDAGGHVIVNGQKFYSSGALLAHLC
ncbi:hypothetical protein GGD55_004705 [Rhizobium giardinii]|uniref:Acyl-CoA dehydrogenase n=1 Tax=Rhizobium giardinii TaxID=56731 RepID=A0A7W8UFT0_9HYPH|nr:hypothetical protein [Rhizobium giardinii]